MGICQVIRQVNCKEGEKMKEAFKPNQIRHSDNLRIYSGRYHGTFYLSGKPQPQQERQLTPLEKAIIQEDIRRSVRKEIKKPK